MVAIIHSSHLALWSQWVSHPRGARPDGGHLAALAGSAPKEEAGGLPLVLQVIRCPVLALRKCCATGNEMDYQGPGLGEGTVDPLLHFTMNWGISCNSFEWMPALVIALQLPVILVEQHALYFVHADIVRGWSCSEMPGCLWWIM